jgi:PAS domain S-box-containing protein
VSEGTTLLGSVGKHLKAVVRPAGTRRRWLFVAFIVFLLALGGLGSWLSVSQTRDARHRVEDDLLSICQLKVSQIATWRTERLRDAASLGGNAPFGLTVARWLETGQQEDLAAIEASLDTQAALFDYFQAALVGHDGTLLVGVRGFRQDLAGDALDAARTACAQRKTVMTDLHLMPDGTTPHVDVLAPVLLDGQTEATACVLLRARADSYLYPLIQSWPVESRSGETLLVRRDGDQVLFLNDLRRYPDAALQLRMPLSNQSLPAAAAVMGRIGIMGGSDYSGVDVLAAIGPVPESPWFVVAKMDSSEALGPVYTRTGLIAGLMGLLILGLVVGAALYWQHGLKERFASAYAESLASHATLERFRYLVQEAQDAIVLADSDARILDVNERASELYGYSREELLGLRLADLVPPETRQDLDAQLTTTREAGRTTHELTGVRKDGTRFPIEVSDRVFQVDGQHLIQAIIRDTSDRKKAESERLDLERQLQHSQRLESLGVLAGGIAHDFNNILTAVLGHADLVLHDMPLSAPGRRGIQEVVAASRRGAELCQQMLAYSGRGQFVIEEIDLGVLIEDMLNLVKSSISKTVLLNLNLGRHLPHIRGDVSQINQVIMNLVINAAEAIGERSGVITISTGAQECTPEYFHKHRFPGALPEGLYVSLEVSDTGVGMDKETMAQIFEPFFTTKFTGRGLGLSAILGIVRGHKGAVVVYSEPGKGSTFKVLFPAVESNEVPPANAAAQNHDWRGQGTVLLVDDEETIRALGKMMLERLGFEVLVAVDGREAVDVFSRDPAAVDLVILDLTMPHMNGDEAFREIRNIRPDAKVMMSSGYSETEITGRFAGKGPAGFIQKPYTLATLRQKIEEALR